MDPAHGRELVDRFGADRERIMILGDLDSMPIDARTIPDPVHQSRDFFIECYERIDRCARELGRTLHRAARSRAPLYGEALREFRQYPRLEASRRGGRPVPDVING